MTTKIKMKDNIGLTDELKITVKDRSLECQNDPLSHKLGAERSHCWDQDLPEDEWCDHCKAHMYNRRLQEGEEDD